MRTYPKGVSVSLVDGPIRPIAKQAKKPVCQPHRRSPSVFVLREGVDVVIRMGKNDDFNWKMF